MNRTITPLKCRRNRLEATSGGRTRPRIPDDQAKVACDPYDRKRKRHIAGEEAMGASAWEYVVPYQPDPGAALDASPAASTSSPVPTVM
jgi:hypothetical protein